MRYRMADALDVSDMTKLYVDYMLKDPPLYPKPGDPTTIAKEWHIAQLTHMLGNPQTYMCIVGVVNSSKQNGVVVGGTVKAFITVHFNVRSLGFPKKVAFCEMLLVDPTFRGREVAKRLVLIACRNAKQLGAEVFEACWRKGSVIGESWKQVGMVPYQEFGAWILEDGTLRDDLIWQDSDLIANPSRIRLPEGKEPD